MFEVARYIKFFKGRKSNLEAYKGVPKKNVVILEYPDEYATDDDDFDSKSHDEDRFKFKVGDGSHIYKELEYSSELPFPVNFYFAKNNFEPWSRD